MIPFSLKLLNAGIELDTVRCLWESTEAQAPALIDATFQRLLEEIRPNVEEGDMEAVTVFQHDLAEEGFRRSSRSTALLQAWVIFEETASRCAKELQRRGKVIGKKRPDESFITWAGRELSLFAGNKQHTQLERMEMLRCLRNIIIHNNGYYKSMKKDDRARVDSWVAKNMGVLLEDGRLHFSAAFIATIFDTVSLALFSLNGLFREVPE
jgi:hypothetical protein